MQTKYVLPVISEEATPDAGNRLPGVLTSKQAWARKFGLFPGEYARYENSK